MQTQAVVAGPRRALALAAGVAALVACAGCTARHFGRVTGPAAAGVAPIVLDVDAHRHGRAEATFADERCGGEFNTVPAQITMAGEDGLSEDTELTQVGLLVLACPSGRVLHCEFSREFYGPGSGSCRDAAGVNYALELF